MNPANPTPVSPRPRLPALILAVLAFLCGPLLSAQEADAPATLITSDRLLLETGAMENTFRFAGKVSVKGNNLEAQCDRMAVVSERTGEDDDSIGDIGSIRTIVAEGNVVIRQAGRSAWADRAEIYPRDGRVELIGNVKVEDSAGTVSGHHLVLNRGEREATIVGEGDTRPTVELPSLPDLGYENEQDD